MLCPDFVLGRHRADLWGCILSAVDIGHLRAVYAFMYTLSMAKTVPVRELRSNLSSLLDDVSDRRDHVLVTRNGAPAAALVPIDEYEALEETAEVLSDPDALSALEAGLAEIARGETVALAELRTELAERRAAAG
jgi:antitoxin YefM